MIEKEKRMLISKVPLEEQLHNSNFSVVKRYKNKVFGDGKLFLFLEYELVNVFFGNISGGIGYVVRKWLYRRLFKEMGNVTILGKGLVIRHPQRIRIGHHVAIDDYAMLDASGAGEEGMIVGDNVIISRNCVVQAKTGPVEIGEKTDIGCNTVLSSVNGLFIGRLCLIAGNCYIGGGRYISDRLEMPMMEQGVYSEGEIVIGDDVWLGAGAIVLDGVRIGKGCIVGAGAVITKDLPDYSIAVGVPGRVIGSRMEYAGEVRTGKVFEAYNGS